jgi:hypothetical protein
MTDHEPLPDFTKWWKPWQRALAEKHSLTCPPGWYGFACGEGWATLLDEAFGALRALGWNGEIHQIKEKFGTLRFYVAQDGDQRFRPIIEKAEAASTRTCEECGAPGTLCGLTSWWHTLCPGCDGKYHEGKR